VLEATVGLVLVYAVGAMVGPASVSPFMDAFRLEVRLFFFAGVLTILGCYGV